MALSKYRGMLGTISTITKEEGLTHCGKTLYFGGYGLVSMSQLNPCMLVRILLVMFLCQRNDLVALQPLSIGFIGRVIPRMY